MLRGWKGIAVAIAIAIALFTGAVLHAVHKAPRARGYSGLTLAPLSPAAAARTPGLRGGAQVAAVAAGSPAAKAGLKVDEVVAALDDKAVTSAQQATALMRDARIGDRITVTLYDLARGEGKPRRLAFRLEAPPLPNKSFSVYPPRLLAREAFNPVTVAANAAWSPRIFRGPTIRPKALTGLGAGRCNAFAPELWRVAAHAPDNSLFHMMAEEGFIHAVYKSGTLDGQDADAFLRAFLKDTFRYPPLLTPPQARPQGFILRDYGNGRGGAGFVLYRVTGKRIALWAVAVAGAEASWAKPLAGSVVLSMRCASPGAPAPAKPDPAQPPTTTSLRCQEGACDETDFAAAYLAALRLGYVHNIKGDMFLVKPKQDFWQNGAEGPGYYHQIGGENERLYPGRIN